MNITTIKAMYDIATLIQKAQATATSYQFIWDGCQDIYRHCAEYSIDTLEHWDNEVKKAETAFRKAGRELLNYFSVPVLDRWNKKEIKKADVFDIKNACNELLKNEYGAYCSRLNWEQIDLIKQVTKLSDYTTDIEFGA